MFNRAFGRKTKIPYPAELQFQIDKAMQGLQALTEAHDGTWNISQAEWSVDQDEGTIVFTCPTGIRAVAPVQIIGTYDTLDGTWLWGWDHPSIADLLAEHAKQVLAYGRERGFDALTTRKQHCPEEQCWDFTALACMLCEAQGAYRGPAGTARVFFTFGHVTLTKAP